MRTLLCLSVAKGFAMQSEWCRMMYELAVEEGRQEDAKAYLEMYELWKSRNL